MALHIYVLPNTVLRPPQPAATPSLSTHPPLPKSWWCASEQRILVVGVGIPTFRACSLLPPPLSLSLLLSRWLALSPASSSSFSLSKSTTQPFQLSNRATRTLPNAGPRRTTVHPPLFRSALSASIHPLLAFSFFYPDSSTSFARTNRLSRSLAILLSAALHPN